jgi:hypothetical protein
VATPSAGLHSIYDQNRRRLLAGKSGRIGVAKVERGIRRHGYHLFIAV